MLADHNKAAIMVIDIVAKLQERMAVLQSMVLNMSAIVKALAEPKVKKPDEPYKRLPGYQ